MNNDDVSEFNRDLVERVEDQDAEIARLRALVRNAAKGLKIIAETSLPKDVAALQFDFDRARVIAECALAAIPEDDK